MRALVTGGAGFIGSHVVDRLIKERHDVLIIDDLSSGKIGNVHPQATLLQHCITTAEAAAAVTDFAPEWVFHLAAQMDVRVSVKRPVFDAQVNIVGTVNIVEAARKGGTLQKVIFASTGGAIYGDTQQFPTPETAPTLPSSAYGTAKLCAEHYLAWFSRMYGISWAAMRFGNVYGPRQDPHGEAGVIAIFAGQLKRKEPCIIFGNGAHARDYVFVEDVVTAFTTVASHPNGQGAFNIGTAIETDLNSLYAQLAAIAESELHPKYAPSRPGESLRSVLDIARAENTLGWAPQVQLAEGLQRVWTHLCEDT